MTTAIARIDGADDITNDGDFATENDKSPPSPPPPGGRMKFKIDRLPKTRDLVEDAGY